MTQPTEAVGGDGIPADANPATPFEDIAADMLGEDEEQEEELAEEGDEPDAELDSEEEAEPEADDLPAIEPPHSLTPEEKEAFKSLPREAQEFTARRIGELEKGFNAKAQEAARIKQQTEHAAIEQLAQIEQQYAQHYQAIAAQFDVPKPSLELLAYDQGQYFAQMQRYEDAQAQRSQAQQTAAQYAQQAQAREEQVAQAQLAQEYSVIVENFPEWTDPTTGPKLQQELSAVARELGYPTELIAEARATDILAMRKAAEWKAKADQLDRLNAGKMQKVRDAKGKPKVATPGVSVTGDHARAARADQAFQRAKGARSQAERADAFADYLTNKGII